MAVSPVVHLLGQSGGFVNVGEHKSVGFAAPPPPGPILIHCVADQPTLMGPTADVLNADFEFHARPPIGGIRYESDNWRVVPVDHRFMNHSTVP